ncbi:MAG: L-2-amino-thiazoline-4-carboxylic acid hydrolase [Clostridia bacterium]|nr:L-2-amino-thiazoline-4-carboxylic acid hydrolase [Clostridia bacterium]
MNRKDGTGLISETVPFVIKLCGKEPAEKIIEAAQGKYRELVAQNADESKAMHPHTRQRIYPGIALFQALTEAGVSRENAAEMFRLFYRQRAEKPAASIRKLLKIPGLYRLIPQIFRFMMKKSFGEDAGFRADFYNTPKDEFRADMVVCPYLAICRRYGCPEIVPAFCETDDVAYGNMHPCVIWGRTKTLGKGSDCCDFHIVLKNRREL